MNRSAAYLILQGVLGAAWWCLLLLDPGSRAWFLPEAFPENVLLAFWLADFVFVVAASWLGAWMILRRHPARKGTVWFAAGGVGCTALYCLGLSILTGEAWLATAMMMPAMILTYVVAMRLQ